MNYQQTIEYMYSSLPMFSRIGAAALKPGLENTINFCNYLQKPQNGFKSIHVGGTNGKGSSSHMLAAILQSAGYKTGLYTSPHLKKFTERIKINGLEISEAEVTNFVSLHKSEIDKLQLSFFEMTVGMAFDFFSKKKVDIAVIEVGLGGRLDSTNIIVPQVSLITNISLDHQAILGNTITEIAYEKAGIIKNNVPIVISEKQEEIKEVFTQKAFENNSNLVFADQCYQIENADLNQLNIYYEKQYKFKIQPELIGAYQKKNIPGVLSVIDILIEKGWNINNQNIIEGIEKTITLTNLKGRWQLLQTNPTVICDTGHNEAGIQEIVKQIKAYNYKNLYWVFGTVNDKDIDKILKLLPLDCYYFFCQSKIPRALDAFLLFKEAKKHQLNGEIILDVNDALSAAKSKASDNDLIIVAGSTFVVAEIDNLYF